MTKEQTTPISTRVTLEELANIKLSGESTSEFLKNAIEERLERGSLDFVNKKIQELKNKENDLSLQRKLILQKKKDMKKLSDKEVDWLIETKRIIENEPRFIKGRINLYINIFKKSYKISEPEFFKLIQDAETQNILLIEDQKERKVAPKKEKQINPETEKVLKQARRDDFSESEMNEIYSKEKSIGVVSP